MEAAKSKGVNRGRAHRKTNVLEIFVKYKVLSGAGLWILLTTTFSFGFYFASESFILPLIASSLLGYSIWTRSLNWTPLLKWIYDSMGAGLIVQQAAVLYSLELIFLTLHLGPEDYFKRFLTAYGSHTASIMYTICRLPNWKWNYCSRYFYLSSIFTVTSFIGLFTWLTVPLQFKFFGLEGPAQSSQASTIKVNSTSRMDKFSVNYMSLEGGFLLRFFTLFVVQALAYYKADLDNDNNQMLNDVQHLPRRFG